MLTVPAVLKIGKPMGIVKPDGCSVVPFACLAGILVTLAPIFILNLGLNLQPNQFFDFCPQRVSLFSRPGIESREQMNQRAGEGSYHGIAALRQHAVGFGDADFFVCDMPRQAFPNHDLLTRFPAMVQKSCHGWKKMGRSLATATVFARYLSTRSATFSSFSLV